ncbi:MAG: regulatory protein RecX [Desulfomonilia bacterium]
MRSQRRPSSSKASIATSSEGVRYALAVISRRAVSTFELKKNLKVKGAPDEVIEAVMARINELGYLDDYEYARRRALLMAEKGYGNYAIRVFLEGLGLPDAFVTNAVKVLPAELGERKRMKKMIEKRNNLPRVKLIRFLAGRGFPLDLIMDETLGVDA